MLWSYSFSFTGNYAGKWILLNHQDYENKNDYNKNS